jgi:phosphoglycerol transferase MdoB-like AlkP superfamily enzyme
MLFGKASDGAARPAFRWLAWLIALSAVILLPWAAYLAVSLPASASARHWPVAWAGLDVVMSVGLAATAWLAVRRDRRMAFPAVATATLLLVDAWFDVCTAPAGGPLLMALADMCVEVAEATGCLALTVAVWRTFPYGAVPQAGAR